jgi:uncharacterized protein
VDALELALVALWCFVVAVAGGTVGLVLGNIRLPALLLVASSPAAGAGANIGVSGVAAATAGLVHVRAGRIDWRLFAWLAPASVVGAVVGGYVSGLLPGDLLLGVIGGVLLAMAIDILRPRDPARARRLRPSELVAVGGVIGFVGGVVGLILGALRLPALIRFGEPLPLAIGTNLVVGIFVGAAGVLGHAPGGIDWTLLGVGSAASVPGALLGARLTGRMPEQRLKHAIAAVLVVAGSVALVEAVA